MTKAIVIHQYGGPEVLQWEDIEVGDPGPDEVRIKHEAIGLNFRDTYHRSGSYGVPGDKFPAIIGGDGGGIIEAVGENVTNLSVGQRVAYGNGPMGSYAQARLMPAKFVVALPDDIDYQTAAAMMVKGMTAQYLVRQCYDVKAGDTILIQAVAGGVGLILCQWAKHLGATVIGTVSTEEKAELARSYGCDHAINYSTEDFAKRVREITDGEGVPVAYDGVGASTFEGSIDSLRICGTLVGYGNASGNFPKFDPLLLMDKGSLYFQRTSMKDFVRDRAELEQVSGELMALVSDGTIKIEISKTYPLQDAPQAHIDLEARKTAGSVVYLPNS
ncbi:MAG: quinone oxidoreductase [Rhodospirillaceae bacterium]|jgi:NADPH:quinone reductase|nr:quinone oxidoreductase [Rhodospirillaceae bacterium]MBT4937699.1 quinone oxidoreductase [Rhodospirillaceae bacterium]MBT7267140.1 quinone oxidoreductase [Rhodospirillaceae bacterium]